MPCFVLRNCHHQFLSREMAWVDVHTDNAHAALFHTPHRDVALNQLVELCAKDFQLRAEVISTELDTKNRPMIPQQETAA